MAEDCKGEDDDKNEETWEDEGLVYGDTDGREGMFFFVWGGGLAGWVGVEEGEELGGTILCFFNTLRDANVRNKYLDYTWTNTPQWEFQGGRDHRKEGWMDGIMLLFQYTVQQQWKFKQ